MLEKCRDWLGAHVCISLKENGKSCSKAVRFDGERCAKCWDELSRSSNGLLRVRVATELDRIAGVTPEAFARLANDPVTAVRVAFVEHAPTLSSGWQMQMADDKEASVWRALAQREDLSHNAAHQLLTHNDDFTLGYLIDNEACPVSVIRWVAKNKAGELAAAAQKTLEIQL